MEETYTTAASNIIRDAIRSVIFVDDQLALPFENNVDQYQLDLSSGLYSSFTANDSGLDFYKYNPDQEWELKKEYFFKGRDLLVIDWQLDTDDDKHRNTLRILREAVNRPSLHFVCIYTATEVAGFGDILYQIGSYFSVADREKAERTLSKIKTAFDDDDLFDEVFGSQMNGKLKELVLYKNISDDLLKEVRQVIINATSGQFYALVKSALKSEYASEKEGFAAIGAIINKVITGEGGNACDISVHTAGNFLKINHTLILLLNKTDVEPLNLYTKFSEAVISSSGNFLTLLGLEMRNLYRAGSAFVGKDIDSINELAFFYHQKQAHPKEAFSEFLGELYKNQAFSFLYDRDTYPKLFDYLPEYIERKQLKNSIDNYKAQPDSSIGLSRLNYYYNILNTKRVTSDRVRFGDIFKLQPLPDSTADDYLLCVTAHCDCLYPAKIQDMFYFIKGTRDNLVNALEKGDTSFHSYIINEGNVNAIKWMDKPFTIYIPSNKNNIDCPISITIADEQRLLNYHSTIKENYAQRMANQAASYPLRVGIFFADFKPGNA